MAAMREEQSGKMAIPAHCSRDSGHPQVLLWVSVSSSVKLGGGYTESPRAPMIAARLHQGEGIQTNSMV